MAKILLTCHVAKNSKFEIWGMALHAVFLHVLPPPVPLTCSLKYRPGERKRGEREIGREREERHKEVCNPTRQHIHANMYGIA